MNEEKNNNYNEEDDFTYTQPHYKTQATVNEQYKSTTSSSNINNDNLNIANKMNAAFTIAGVGIFFSIVSFIFAFLNLFGNIVFQSGLFNGAITSFIGVIFLAIICFIISVALFLNAIIKKSQIISGLNVSLLSTSILVLIISVIVFSINISLFSIIFIALDIYYIVNSLLIFKKLKK